MSIPPRLTALEDPLPDQGLCLGASFTIAATNGVDPTRRLRLLGFCRSVEHLSRQVEDCVLRRGGEIMLHHVELRRCGGSALACCPAAHTGLFQHLQLYPMHAPQMCLYVLHVIV